MAKDPGGGGVVLRMRATQTAQLDDPSSVLPASPSRHTPMATQGTSSHSTTGQASSGCIALTASLYKACFLKHSEFDLTPNPCSSPHTLGCLGMCWVWELGSMSCVTQSLVAVVVVE